MGVCGSYWLHVGGCNCLGVAMTYLLTVGMAMAVGCGTDGSDQVRLFNMPVASYSTYAECRQAGKELQRGFNCRKVME